MVGIGIAGKIVCVVPGVDVITVEMDEAFVAQLVVVVGGDGVPLGFHFVVDMVANVLIFYVSNVVFP